MSTFKNSTIYNFMHAWHCSPGLGGYQQHKTNPSVVSEPCPKAPLKARAQLRGAEAIAHLYRSLLQPCRIKSCSSFLIKQMRWKTGGFSDVVVMIRAELLTFHFSQRTVIMDFICRMSAKFCKSCYNSDISWLKLMLFSINSGCKLTGDLSFTAL